MHHRLMEESFGERSITFTLPLNWKIDPSLIYSIDYKLQILSVYLLFFLLFYHFGDSIFHTLRSTLRQWRNNKIGVNGTQER